MIDEIVDSAIRKEAGVWDAIARLISRGTGVAGKGIGRAAAGRITRATPQSLSQLLKAEAAGTAKTLPVRAAVPISTAELRAPQLLSSLHGGAASPAALAATQQRLALSPEVFAKTEFQGALGMPTRVPGVPTRTSGIPTRAPGTPTVAAGTPTRPPGTPTQLSQVQTPASIVQHGPQEITPRILPPMPTSSVIPVTPPLPGSPAYFRNAFTQGGQQLRQGVLNRDMFNTLGPTGLPLAPMGNPGQMALDQLSQSTTRTPLFAKTNSLIERVKMSAFLSALLNRI